MNNIINNRNLIIGFSIIYFVLLRIIIPWFISQTINIDSSLINFNFNFWIPALLGNVSLSFFLIRSLSINKEARLIRRILYTFLLFFTLLSYVCFGVLLFPCSDFINLEDINVNNNIGTLRSIFIAVIVFCIIVIVIIERPRFQVKQPEVSQPNHDPERFNKFLIAVSLGITMACIPFVIDRVIAFIMADLNTPVGKIVGINDFYLIPAILGSTEGYIAITSNTELDSNLRLTRRLAITITQILTLISFSFFSFGCNSCISMNLYGVRTAFTAIVLTGLIGIALIFNNLIDSSS